jgi:ATP adenylyltransferase
VTTFERLRKFVTDEMAMSHVYQPVMLITLLQNAGASSAAEIAEAILKQDPTQIEYYTQIVKNMVGRVLTNNRGITSKDGSVYHLNGAGELTDTQKNELVELCNARIKAYIESRGEAIWQHRKRGHRPISGSIRYQVLKRAHFRCELCGVMDGEKALEVDHIHPKSLGGKDDLSNYQALCYSCNAAKRNTDNSDFRELNKAYDHRDCTCLFCTLPEERIVSSNSLALAIRDGFPVTEGHTLIIPKRHVADYFGLFQPEINAINRLLAEQKEKLQKEDGMIEGFNIGMNCGESAGQTIFHCHIHLIPRRVGDVENPRGGIRHLIPGRGNY